MFGIKKKETKSKLNKDDYNNPIFVKGIEHLETYGQERLLKNKMTALIATASPKLMDFSDMLEDLSEEEYKEFIKFNVHSA